MNFKTTFILVLLLGIVGAYFYFVSMKGKPTGPDTPGPGDMKPLITQIPSDVNALAVTKGDTTIEMLRPGAPDTRWFQTAPVRFPLNEWSAKDELIPKALNLLYSQSFEPGRDDMPTLKDINLDPPLATLTLQRATTTTDRKIIHTIKLGKTVTGNRGYAMVNDDKKVYVVAGDLHKILLDQDINDWRIKDIVGPQIAQAESITLSGMNNGTISLSKKNSEWFLSASETPENSRADTTAVNDLLVAFDSINIAKFTDDNPEDLSPYGLDKPRMAIDITRVGAKPDETVTISVSIGAPVDLTGARYFATWSPEGQADTVVLEIGASHVTALTKSVDDMRDPRITPTKFGNVKQLNITRSAGALSLLKSTSGWEFPNGVGYAVDQNKASELIEQILRAGAVGYLSNAKLTGEALATIALTTIGTNEADRITVHDPVGQSETIAQQLGSKNFDPKEHYLTRRSGESVVYIVDRSKLNRIFQSPLALRDRMVLDLKPDQLKKITVKQFNSVVHEFNQSTPEPPAKPDPFWNLSGHESFEGAAFEYLLQQLLPLKAESWLDLDPKTGDVVLGLYTKDDKKIIVTFDAKRNMAMTLHGGKKVFQVSKDLIEALTTDFRDRNVLPVNVDQLKSVELTREGLSLTVRKDANGQFVSNEVSLIEQSAAQQFFDTLAGLRAERLIDKPDEAPTVDFTISGKATNGKFKVSIHKSDERVVSIVAKIGDRTIDQWFTVNELTLDKLRAKLVKRR